MKATEAKLLAFLKKAPQFVIPIYQRTYSWTEKECRQLWDDILRAGRDPKISVHFIGSIVYVEEGLGQVVLQAPLLVIDGQQRLTTVSLLLAALVGALGDKEPVVGFSASKVRNYYLVNPEERGERHFKLLLSQTDRATLTAIVGGTETPDPHSLRVRENHEIFKQLLTSLNGKLDDVCNGLAKLVVVDIALTLWSRQPAADFREHELHRPRVEPGGSHSQLCADGVRASLADKALRGVLAPDGSWIWATSLRLTFRRLHAALSDPQDRRNSAR